ncbi:MAG: hypothetical protein NZ740_01030 [Kiritimatiellae bacterium]|nr:hypothetical protein [Kiritimatiellia bacterium]MDW8457674.1 hypothetical protein [Verrucomicrobiota bacterium]
MSKKLFSAKLGRQISVFLENRPGTLSEVIDTLRENGINMLALSLSEGLDIGYLRIIVDQHECAVDVLRRAGHLVIERDVVLLTVANEPGGLASAVDIWARAGINIEYAYSADDESADKSLIVARVNDIPKALVVLESALRA